MMMTMTPPSNKQQTNNKCNHIYENNKQQQPESNELLGANRKRPVASKLAAMSAFLALSWLMLAQLSLLTGAVHSAASSSPTNQQMASTCKRELLSANRTLTSWASNLETMVTESKLPSSSRENIHKAANQVLDAIEDFGHRVETRPASQLAKDLVAIRRQSNRMALEIYLHTLDMRWPQTSLQLSTTIERVQQACLDRHSIQALEADPNPIEELSSMRQ